MGKCGKNKRFISVAIRRDIDDMLTDIINKAAVKQRVTRSQLINDLLEISLSIIAAHQDNEIKEE